MVKIIIHKDPESDFGVTVPDLPGCFAAGDTMEELLKRNNDNSAIWGVVSIDLNKLSDRTKRVNITIPEKLQQLIGRYWT